MIDYSKWYITSDNGSDYISVVNESENIRLWVQIRTDKVDPDNPDAHIKAEAKEEIKRWHVHRRLEQLKGQRIPVEDNLDYIENEAKRRGLE